jgi:hypothetical protein
MARGEQIQANAENRALGILIAYVLVKFGMTALEIGAPLRTRRELKDSTLRSYVQALQKGEMTLSDEDFEALKWHLESIIRDNAQIIGADYSFLWAIFQRIGIEDSAIPIPLPDYVQLDKELLRSLNLDLLSQNSDHQRGLFNKIGGLWYVVRRSTGRDPYNVSLLSVKPQRYAIKRRRDWHYIDTHLLQFSLRARSDNVQLPASAPRHAGLQTFRGRVVDFGGTTYFIGNREPSARMFLMAWSTREQTNHGLQGSGLITTVASSDATISAPIGVMFDRGSTLSSIPRESGESNDHWLQRVADVFAKKIEEAESRIAAMSREALTNALGHVIELSVINTVIDELDAKTALGSQGYFRLPAEGSDDG